MRLYKIVLLVLLMVTTTVVLMVMRFTTMRDFAGSFY